MKNKYTKAKLEIISMKTEAFICTSPENNTGTTGGLVNGGGDTTPVEEPAKAFDVNGIKDFPSDSIPPTKE